MLIVPRFSVSQTDSEVVISIRVPYVRVTSSEVHAQGREFTFFCKPYLLKLTLPLPVLGEEARAVYDPNEVNRELEERKLCGSVADSGWGGAQENGTIVCYLPKEQHVHFPDLDMISQLLATRRRQDEELSTWYLIGFCTNGRSGAEVCVGLGREQRGAIAWAGHRGARHGGGRCEP